MAAEDSSSSSSSGDDDSSKEGPMFDVPNPWDNHYRGHMNKINAPPGSKPNYIELRNKLMGLIKLDPSCTEFVTRQISKLERFYGQVVTEKSIANGASPTLAMHSSRIHSQVGSLDALNIWFASIVKKWLDKETMVQDAENVLTYAWRENVSAFYGAQNPEIEPDPFIVHFPITKVFSAVDIFNWYLTNNDKSETTELITVMLDAFKLNASSEEPEPVPIQTIPSEIIDNPAPTPSTSTKPVPRTTTTPHRPSVVSKPTPTPVVSTVTTPVPRRPPFVPKPGFVPKPIYPSASSSSPRPQAYTTPQHPTTQFMFPSVSPTSPIFSSRLQPLKQYMPDTESFSRPIYEQKREPVVGAKNAAIAARSIRAAGVASNRRPTGSSKFAALRRQVTTSAGSFAKRITQSPIVSAAASGGKVVPPVTAPEETIPRKRPHPSPQGPVTPMRGGMITPKQSKTPSTPVAPIQKPITSVPDVSPIKTPQIQQSGYVDITTMGSSESGSSFSTDSSSASLPGSSMMQTPPHHSVPSASRPTRLYYPGRGKSSTTEPPVSPNSSVSSYSVSQSSSFTSSGSPSSPPKKRYRTDSVSVDEEDEKSKQIEPTQIDSPVPCKPIDRTEIDAALKLVESKEPTCFPLCFKRLVESPKSIRRSIKHNTPLCILVKWLSAEGIDLLRKEFALAGTEFELPTVSDLLMCTKKMAYEISTVLKKSIDLEKEIIASKKLAREAPLPSSKLIWGTLGKQPAVNMMWLCYNSKYGYGKYGFIDPSVATPDDLYSTVPRVSDMISEYDSEVFDLEIRKSTEVWGADFRARNVEKMINPIVSTERRILVQLMEILFGTRTGVNAITFNPSMLESARREFLGQNGIQSTDPQTGVSTFRNALDTVFIPEEELPIIAERQRQDTANLICKTVTKVICSWLSILVRKTINKMDSSVSRHLSTKVSELSVIARRTLERINRAMLSYDIMSTSHRNVEMFIHAAYYAIETCTIPAVLLPPSESEASENVQVPPALTGGITEPPIPAPSPAPAPAPAPVSTPIIPLEEPKQSKHGDKEEKKHKKHKKHHHSDKKSKKSHKKHKKHDGEESGKKHKKHNHSDKKEKKHEDKPKISKKKSEQEKLELKKQRAEQRVKAKHPNSRVGETLTILSPWYPCPDFTRLTMFPYDPVTNTTSTSATDLAVEPVSTQSITLYNGKMRAAIPLLRDVTVNVRMPFMDQCVKMLSADTVHELEQLPTQQVFRKKLIKTAKVSMAINQSGSQPGIETQKTKMDPQIATELMHEFFTHGHGGLLVARNEALPNRMFGLDEVSTMNASLAQYQRSFSTLVISSLGIDPMQQGEQGILDEDESQIAYVPNIPKVLPGDTVPVGPIHKTKAPTSIPIGELKRARAGTLRIMIDLVNAKRPIRPTLTKEELETNALYNQGIDQMKDAIHTQLEKYQVGREEKPLTLAHWLFDNQCELAWKQMHMDSIGQLAFEYIEYGTDMRQFLLERLYENGRIIDAATLVPDLIDIPNDIFYGMISNPCVQSIDLLCHAVVEESLKSDVRQIAKPSMLFISICCALVATFEQVHKSYGTDPEKFYTTALKESINTGIIHIRNTTGRGTWTTFDFVIPKFALSYLKWMASIGNYGTVAAFDIDTPIPSCKVFFAIIHNELLRSFARLCEYSDVAMPQLSRALKLIANGGADPASTDLLTREVPQITYIDRPEFARGQDSALISRITHSKATLLTIDQMRRSIILGDFMAYNIPIKMKLVNNLTKYVMESTRRDKFGITIYINNVRRAPGFTLTYTGIPDNILLIPQQPFDVYYVEESERLKQEHAKLSASVQPPSIIGGGSGSIPTDKPPVKTPKVRKIRKPGDATKIRKPRKVTKKNPAPAPAPAPAPVPEPGQQGGVLDTIPTEEELALRKMYEKLNEFKKKKEAQSKPPGKP